jgi:hypothetical protein
MAGKAEISKGHLSAPPGDAPKTEATTHAGGRMRRWLIPSRRQDVVPSLPSTSSPASAVKTGGQAEHARPVPSHQQEDAAPLTQERDNTPARTGELIMMREPWGNRAVFFPPAEEGSVQITDRPRDAIEIVSDEAPEVTAGHPAMYTARLFFPTKASENDADASHKPVTDSRGDGDSEPPDGKGGFAEAEEPEPHKRAKRYLSERLQQVGITPGSPSYATVKQWANHETFASVKEKMAREQRDDSQEDLADAVDQVFADSLRKINTFSQSHPREYEDATNLFSELLPHYEDAVRETDASLSPIDLRIRAADLIGTHMDEVDGEMQEVFAEEPNQSDIPEAQEASGETLEQVKERLTKLVHATDPDSPKLAYLKKYASYVMKKNKVYEQFLSGDIKQKKYTDTIFELREVFETESMSDEQRLAEYGAQDIKDFFDQGIFPLYKNAVILQRGGINYKTVESIKVEAMIDIQAATQIHADLEELASQERPQEVYTEPGEHPYAQAQEKLMGEFLANDWVKKPLLSEILRLQLRKAQAEAVGMRAIIAHKEKKISRTEEQELIDEAMEKRNALHKQFMDKNGWKWMVQRDMPAYDFYAALWEGEEVYQTYVDAAFKEDPPAEHGMVPAARARINAASMFRRDVMPLIITQNILKIRGQIWDIFRYPRI